MWIHYDLKYNLKQGDDWCSHKDVGMINISKIQGIELTASALYINLSDNHLIRFEYDPVMLFDIFKKAIGGQGSIIEDVGQVHVI